MSKPQTKTPARKAAAGRKKPATAAGLDLLGENRSDSLRFVIASHTGAAGHCPAQIGAKGRPTLVDKQKMRNNWWKVSRRDQVSACRQVADMNWFVREVRSLRVPVTISGFRLVPKPAKQPADGGVVAEPAGGDDTGAAYAFAPLMRDIADEDFVASNVVALWRTGVESPPVSILDGEVVDYRSCGGLERITVQCSADPVMAADRDNKDFYVEALGQRMYDACCKGKTITIIKGKDADWSFEVMTGGKRRGQFIPPALVNLLDDLDFLELFKVGDWNLAWFRQQVIRFIQKGYAVTVGNGAGVNSVNMTPAERDEFGEGFSKLATMANIPVNHDVKIGYLTIDPENFDPKQVESVIDRLLFWGGIEAIALFGNFSQQNGAAPSLMRNLRIRVTDQRERYEEFMRRVFSAPEFQSLGVAGMNFHWSVKGLYSLEELLKLVTGTSDGVASPQTRRGWLDLDDAEESRLMGEAHGRRQDYTPPFESRQGLVAPQFPEDFPGMEKQAQQNQPSGDDVPPGPEPSPSQA